MELISVIIPAYNAALFLRQAVESVLIQAYRPLEILIVTGPSTDNTSAIAESFGPPIKVIYEKRLGDAAARNTGLRHASGDLLAFLDADDYWHPDKLAIQLKALSADPTLDMVFGYIQEFKESNVPSEPVILGQRLPAQVAGVLLVRRPAFLRVGLYEEEFTLGSTVSWYLRAREAELHEICLPETLLYRRIHNDSLGHRHHAKQIEYARVLKAHLDRKRGKPNL
jgi:glycosyltransferase involved in cell wall biosynthesis